MSKRESMGNQPTGKNNVSQDFSDLQPTQNVELLKLESRGVSLVHPSWNSPHERDCEWENLWLPSTPFTFIMSRIGNMKFGKLMRNFR